MRPVRPAAAGELGLAEPELMADAEALTEERPPGKRAVHFNLRSLKPELQ
jgi:hypothetical protein